MFTALQIGENFLGPTVPSAPAERLYGSLSTNDVTEFKNHKNHRWKQTTLQSNNYGTNTSSVVDTVLAFSFKNWNRYYIICCRLLSAKLCFKLITKTLYNWMKFVKVNNKKIIMTSLVDFAEICHLFFEKIHIYP